MSELKDRLKEARRDAKLSQARLAQLDGLKNQSIIGSIESGHRKTTTYIVQLAKILNVEPLWLDKGEGPKEAIRNKPGITDELSRFLGIPKNLITMEMIDQVQAFAKESDEHRSKALTHIQEVKNGRIQGSRYFNFQTI